MLGSTATLLGINPVFILIGAGVLFLLSVATILSTLFRGKNDKPPVQKHDDFFYERDSKGSDDIATEIFDSSFSEAEYTITLSNPRDANKSWTMNIRGEILIGRASHNDIILDEGSVARNQCKIVIESPGLSVVNLSTTNITMLNGAKISGSSHLRTGDRLTMGRETLRVDHIKALDSPVLID